MKALDAVSRKRFEREAELTERFKHPNIVHLYARGEVDGVAYLALEYLDGLTLDAYIEARERIPFPEALDILGEIGAALKFAHAQGLVHRDIKPSNIMLRKLPDGGQQAVLMDLGLAKVIGESSTVTGIDAIGTIAYMSPEQIQEGRAVDTRSDIYSLGVMAYQMLTGELPFQGGAGKMLFGHLNQPAPDPQTLVPDLPLEVAVAIQITMEKSPDDRFQDVGTFLKAIGLVASSN
jgi:eukaryotic-like serine/threonine-protein kinase